MDWWSAAWCNADFVDDAAWQAVFEHPGYYGEMIWISMMLEQWLRAQAPAILNFKKLGQSLSQIDMSFRF